MNIFSAGGTLVGIRDKLIKKDGVDVVRKDSTLRDLCQVAEAQANKIAKAVSQAKDVSEASYESARKAFKSALVELADYLKSEYKDYLVDDAGQYFKNSSALAEYLGFTESGINLLTGKSVNSSVENISSAGFLLELKPYLTKDGYDFVKTDKTIRQLANDVESFKSEMSESKKSDGWKKLQMFWNSLTKNQALNKDGKNLGDVEDVAQALGIAASFDPEKFAKVLSAFSKDRGMAMPKVARTSNGFEVDFGQLASAMEADKLRVAFRKKLYSTHAVSFAGNEPCTVVAYVVPRTNNILSAPVPGFRFGHLTASQRASVPGAITKASGWVDSSRGEWKDDFRISIRELLAQVPLFKKVPDSEKKIRKEVLDAQHWAYWYSEKMPNGVPYMVEFHVDPTDYDGEPGYCEVFVERDDDGRVLDQFVIDDITDYELDKVDCITEAVQRDIDTEGSEVLHYGKGAAYSARRVASGSTAPQRSTPILSATGPVHREPFRQVSSRQVPSQAHQVRRTSVMASRSKYSRSAYPADYVRSSRRVPSRQGLNSESRQGLNSESRLSRYQENYEIVRRAFQELDGELKWLDDGWLRGNATARGWLPGDLAPDALHVEGLFEQIFTSGYRAGTLKVDHVELLNYDDREGIQYLNLYVYDGGWTKAVGEYDSQIHSSRSGFSRRVSSRRGLSSRRGVSSTGPDLSEAMRVKLDNAMYTYALSKGGDVSWSKFLGFPTDVDPDYKLTAEIWMPAYKFRSAQSVLNDFKDFCEYRDMHDCWLDTATIREDGDRVYVTLGMSYSYRGVSSSRRRFS